LPPFGPRIEVVPRSSQISRSVFLNGILRTNAVPPLAILLLPPHPFYAPVVMRAFFFRFLRFLVNLFFLLFSFDLLPFGEFVFKPPRAGDPSGACVPVLPRFAMTFFRFSFAFFSEPIRFASFLLSALCSRPTPFFSKLEVIFPSSFFQHDRFHHFYAIPFRSPRFKFPFPLSSFPGEAYQRSLIPIDRRNLLLDFFSSEYVPLTFSRVFR